MYRERPRRAPSRSRARRRRRRDLQSALFDVDQELAPALGALPDADLEADQFLLAFRCRADQHQHTFAVVFHAGLQEDAIGHTYTYRRADRSRLCQRSYSPCHSAVSRDTTAGDRFGASLPSKAVSASWKSLVEMPRR